MTFHAACPPRFGDTVRNQLRDLLRRGPVTQSETQEALGVGNRYAAAILYQLERRGEVVSSTDPITGSRVWQLANANPIRKG